MTYNYLKHIPGCILIFLVVFGAFYISNAETIPPINKDYSVRPDGSILYTNGQLSYGLSTFTATDDIKYLKSDYPGASFVDQGVYWSTPEPSPLSGRFYDDGRIYLGKDTDHYVGMQPVGIFYVNYQDPTEREQLISLTSMSLSVNDNVATYTQGPVSIVFTNSFSQIKGDVIFPNAPPIPTVSNPALAVVWKVVGHAGISMEDGEQGEWWFEQAKAAFPVGDIQNNGSAVLKKKIFRQNGKIYLVEGVGYGWVSDVNRTDSQFVIDPTLEYNGTDNWVGTSGTMIEHGDGNLRAPPNVTTGLVSFWNPATDVGSGNTLTDIWGNNDGTIHGATWNASGGLYYNGSVWVDCGTDSSLLMSSGNYTLIANFSSSSTADSDKYIVTKGHANRYRLALASHQIEHQIDDNTVLKEVQTTSTYNDGLFYDAVGVRDGNNLRLFIDGNEDVNSPTNITGYGSLDDANPFTLGQRSGEAAGYFIGTIARTCLYNNSLTNDHINETIANYHTNTSHIQTTTVNDYGAGQVLKYINVTGTDPSVNTTMALYVNGSHDNVTFNGWELVNGSCNVGDNVTVPIAYEYRYIGSPGVKVVSNTTYQPETNVIESIILASSSESIGIETFSGVTFLAIASAFVAIAFGAKRWINRRRKR